MGNAIIVSLRMSEAFANSTHQMLNDLLVIQAIPSKYKIVTHQENVHIVQVSSSTIFYRVWNDLSLYILSSLFKMDSFMYTVTYSLS